MRRVVPQSPGSLYSCLPNATQARLLRVCLAEDPAEVLAAWTAWIANVEIFTLERASSRLLPLAYHRLAALNVQHAEMPRLGGVLRHAWADNLTRRRHLQGVIAQLDAAGIPHLLLKGAPLAFGAYPHPGARPMDDVDLLVAHARGREALALLYAAGAADIDAPLPPAPTRSSDPDPMLFRHGCPLRTAEGLHLDLHWFALADCCQPGADEHFWTRRRPLPAIPGAFQLAPEDQVLHLCVHGLRGSPLPSIRWIADVVLTLRAAGPAFDWPLLLEEARRRRVVAPVREALRYLQAEFAAPVPATALAALEREPISRLENSALRGHLTSSFWGQAAATWLRYRRTTPQRGPLQAGLGFPTYLGHAWGHISFARVLAHIVQRALRPGQQP